jgi:hypothetical protein
MGIFGNAVRWAEGEGDLGVKTVGEEVNGQEKLGMSVNNDAEPRDGPA